MNEILFSRLSLFEENNYPGNRHPEEARLCWVGGEAPGLTLSPVWPVSCAHLLEIHAFGDIF